MHHGFFMYLIKHQQEQINELKKSNLQPVKLKQLALQKDVFRNGNCNQT